MPIIRAVMSFDSRALQIAIAALCVLAMAADDVVAPHFGSVRRTESYLREGPSYDHRILWIYKKKDYPVFVLSGYGNWLHVRDADGTLGWMHHTQVSDRRTVLFVSAARSPLHASAGRDSKVVAFVHRGVVALLRACEPSACEVEADGIVGWADKQDLWGVMAGEVFH